MSVGIDFGNSFVRVAVKADGENPQLVAVDGNSKEMPTYLYIQQDGKIVVGEEAKTHASSEPKNTINNLKRFTGAAYDLCTSAGQPYPFELVQDNTTSFAAVSCNVNGEKKVFTVKELLTSIFQKVAAIPEVANKRVILTIPPYMNIVQRELVKSAAKDAKLNVIDVIFEPFAAIAAYADQIPTGVRNILVFDISQTNTVVSVCKGRKNSPRLQSWSGDDIGGDSFTGDATQFIAREFRVVYNQPIKTNQEAMDKLFKVIDEGKLKLLEKDNVELSSPQILPNVDYKDTLTREKFDYMIEDTLGACMDIIDRALDSAKISKRDVTDVIVCGGSARLPRVVDVVEQHVGIKPLSGIDPAHVIAIGASKYTQ